MKLTYYQLEAHLKNKLALFYIISGDEIILKQDIIHLIRKAAKQAGFQERKRFASDINEENLYQLLHATSLFSQKCLIEFDFRSALPTKPLCKLLQEYATNPNPDTVIVIDMEKIDSTISKQSWYQIIEKNGVALPVWPITLEQLPQWLTQRARKYHLEFTKEAIQILADYVEGNLVAASQALEKIYLHKPESIVDANLINRLLLDDSQFTIFDFTEHLITGNHSKSLAILTYLQNDGIDPTLILWSITRELRLLAELANKHSQGKNVESLFQTHKIYFRRQTSIKHFLAHKTEKDCWDYLAQALQIDQMIKGGIRGNPWQTLELFCMRF